MNKKSLEKHSPGIGEIWTTYTDEIRELTIFVAVTKAGFSTATQERRAYEVLKTSPVPPNFKELETLNEEELSQMEKRMNFAESEIKNEMPYLLSLASIRLWSILEAMLDECGLCLLKDDINRINDQTLKSLKGPLIDFMNYEKDEQISYLWEQIKIKSEAARKPGVGQINQLLESLNIASRKVPQIITRTILELQQLRHIIIHKNKKADSRLIERCPWLKYKNGETISIDWNQFYAFQLAAMWLTIEIRTRIYISTAKTKVKDVNAQKALKFFENQIKLLKKK